MKFLPISLLSALLACSTIQGDADYKDNYGGVHDYDFGKNYKHKSGYRYHDDDDEYEEDSSQVQNFKDQQCLDYDKKDCCTQCIFRTVNIRGKCKAVSDFCQTWDERTGLCTSCYQGYKNCDGVCKIAGPNAKDFYCTKWNQNGRCTSCAFRTVWSKGKCVVVDDQCKTWNYRNAKCTSCYKGYRLRKGKCQICNQ